MTLSTYQASDRRVYNGAPCSDMQREWNHTNNLENPNLIGPPQTLTGHFYVNKQEALIEALLKLEQKGEEEDKDWDEE